MKKYEQHRHEIKNGDLIVFRGTSITSKLIHIMDRSYYSHIGLVFISNSRLFIIDSNSHGVSPKFLSEVMGHSSDFCILRPNAWNDAQISDAVGKVMDKAEKKISYDFSLISQISLYRLFNIKSSFDKENRDICSEFTRRFVRYLLDPVTDCFEEPSIPTNFITPWDFILYADEQFSILHDESNHKKFRSL